ncbi:MAG: hypothetical protein JWO45_1921 [Spartobacteria bacterium]|nr:hypothetical protein [Spartobacteria bacterium]
MLHFYSPKVSPTKAPKFRPTLFFDQLLRVFGDPARYAFHETLPPDPDLITHLVLRAATPYYLLRKSSPQCFYDHLGPFEHEMIRSGRWQLVLDLGWEMLYPRADILLPFQQDLIAANFPPENVWLINSNLNSKSVYEKVADPSNHVNILQFPVGAFLFLSHHVAQDNDAFQRFLEIETSARSQATTRRHFLNFNGRARPHRNYLVAFLLSRNLDEKGFISLLGYERAVKGSSLRDFDDTDAMVALLNRQCWGWPHVETVSPFYPQLARSLPLELDLSAEDAVKDSRYKVVTPWELQDMALYRRSYFSIVTDTSAVGDDQLFLTEKVFKPLICLHPFVYMGHHGALAKLRQLGFETFEPFFNEAYDREPDSRKRVGLVLNEIARLCALPQAELAGMFAKLWPRLEHNARRGRLDALELGKAEFRTNIFEKLERRA